MDAKHIETRAFPLGKSIRGMMTASGPTGRDIVYTRWFLAPKAVVFSAWTDPKKLARWWGPHAMTNPVCEIDPRPGGRYRIVMRGPNGVEYPLKGEIREVDKPNRLVLTMDAEEHPAEWHEMLQASRPAGSRERGLEVLVTVTFEANGQRTKVTVQSEYQSAETRDAVVKLGSSDGWAQSFERLDVVLARGGRLPARMFQRRAS
jgi:uncharacterized protein YndB with AHSA1/START domain